MGISGEHIHKLITYINTHPAASRENTEVLDIDIDALKNNFNEAANRLLAVIPFKKERDREVTRDALLIKDVHVLYEEDGKVFLIPFSDNIGIFGVTDGGGKCKLLVYAFTLSKIRNITILTGMVMDSFFKTVVPGVDVEELVDELKNFPGENVICNGVSFSLFRKGDLFWYTAVSEKAPILPEKE